MKPETLLALAERLQTRARTAHRRGYTHAAADLRMAATAARQLATLAIADEAATEQDHTRRHQLTQEAAAAWGDVSWLHSACA
jgi:hypothetical protein